MQRRVCTPAALMSCLVLLLPVAVHACPRSCNCYQTSEVHCTFRSLLSVPAGLPPHTRRINLGWVRLRVEAERKGNGLGPTDVHVLRFCRFNSITTVQNKSLAGLKKLELLMLHSNDLHHLPDAAFADLRSLQVNSS